jgi:regulator of PEP synthase PpsR (kinase-PPPase family)
VKVRRISHVRSKNQVYEALDEVLAAKGLVVYTIVNRELARLVHDECNSLGLPSIDLITPLLMRIAEFFGRSPRETPGLLHGVDEEYFRRIEAVEFTVKHDDGQETAHLPKADIVLVGVSRSSKTPLSIYLAHRGWRVANVPLVKGIDPPKELFAVDPKRVVGLVIDPQRLLELRVTRLKHLGMDSRAAYADYAEIEDELKHARAFFRRQPWVVIDVTGKAVEETANEVLVKLKLN